MSGLFCICASDVLYLLHSLHLYLMFSFLRGNVHIWISNKTDCMCCTKLSWSWLNFILRRRYNFRRRPYYTVTLWHFDFLESICRQCRSKQTSGLPHGRHYDDDNDEDDNCDDDDGYHSFGHPHGRHGHYPAESVLLSRWKPDWITPDIQHAGDWNATNRYT